MKNIIKRIHELFMSFIYEEKQIKKNSVPKLDSRSIAAPRYGNSTERQMCAATAFLQADISYVLLYANDYVHASIYWFKYKRDRYTTGLLGRILWDEIVGQVSDRLDIRAAVTNWVVTTAPSTSYHRKDKKWDHNDDLIEELKNISTKNFSFQRIFTLGKESASNKKLNKKERQQSSLSKFSLLPDVNVSNDSGLIIFDDVTTTGSTLKNLEELAQKLKPKIVLLVAIAH